MRETSWNLHAQALDLAARCAILETSLSWHFASETATVGYAKHALQLSEEAFKASGDPSLWLSAYSKLAWAYCYADEDEDALKTACAGQELLLQQDPKQVHACLYGGTHSTLALMQAKTEQDPGDALGVASDQDLGDTVIALMEFRETDRLLESGQAYYHARQYAKARKELEKIIDPSTLVLRIPQGEDRRLRTLHAITLASLKLPDRNMQEIIRFWEVYLEGAKALDSRTALNNIRSLYNDMTNAFPGDARIEGLRSLVPRRKKKTPDA